MPLSRRSNPKQKDDSLHFFQEVLQLTRTEDILQVDFHEPVAGAKYGEHPARVEWGCKAENVEKCHRHEFPECHTSSKQQAGPFARRDYRFLRSLNGLQ